MRNEASACFWVNWLSWRSRGSHEARPQRRPALQKIAPIICLSNPKRTEGKSYYSGVEGFCWWFLSLTSTIRGFFSFFSACTRVCVCAFLCEVMDRPDGDSASSELCHRNALISHCHLDQGYFYTQMAVLAARTVFPSPRSASCPAAWLNTL